MLARLARLLHGALGAQTPEPSPSAWSAWRWGEVRLRDRTALGRFTDPLAGAFLFDEYLLDGSSRVVVVGASHLCEARELSATDVAARVAAARRSVLNVVAGEEPPIDGVTGCGAAIGDNVKLVKTVKQCEACNGSGVAS
jgi:hypothetical protein